MRRALPLLWLLAAAFPAAAATFVATSVEEAARSSEVVVRGIVIRREGRLLDDGRIVTDVQVAVTSAWRGDPDALLTVRVPGGSLGTLALAVDAAPTFADGEDVVLFLARKGPGWVVVGLAQGKYAVHGASARSAFEGARVLERPLAAGERAIGTMAVDELERRVRAVP
jgi:hypothetical protein